MNIRIIVILTAFLIWSANGHTDEIRIAVIDDIPPYTFANAIKGIEVELAEAALEKHTIRFIPVPINRLFYMLKNNEVDSALTLNKSKRDFDICYSIPYIIYRNVAVSLESRQFQIDQISELNGKSIVAFQNARKYLGAEFERATSNQTNYYELKDQSSQLKMLLKERIEIIIIDELILKFFLKKFDYSETLVSIHRIFPESHFHAGFIDTELCEEFSNGISFLRKTGRYDQIINKYKNLLMD